MRLACAWPLLIGFRTLDLIARADNLLDPNVIVKVSRTRRLSYSPVFERPCPLQSRAQAITPLILDDDSVSRGRGSPEHIFLSTHYTLA